MDKYSKAALTALCEVWLEVNTAIESDGSAPPIFRVQLWNMVEHMCTAFAVQHRLAESDVAETFEFLAGNAHTHALMAAQSSTDVRAPAAPVIETASSVRVAALKGTLIH